MKRNAGFLIAFALLFIWFSCGKKGTEPKGPPVPTITDGPRALDVRTNSAEIYWKTDVEANSVVLFGTESATYTDSVVDALQDTLHSVALQNLKSNTTYYYVVASENKSGRVQSGENQFVTAMSFSDLVQAAWNAYEKGQYSQAIQYFNQVIAEHPFWADAYNGLGWCYASGAIDSLDAAEKNFSDAIYHDPKLAEAYAGRGFVYLSQKRYNSAVADFQKCLELQPDFTFSHNSAVDSQDVHLGLAEAYFYRQELDKAQQELDYLEPDNGLSPNDTATWVVDGTSYATYPAALLAWLEKLKSVIG